MSHAHTLPPATGKTLMLSVFSEIRRLPGWNMMDRGEQVAAVARLKATIDHEINAAGGDGKQLERPAPATQRPRQVQMQIRGL